MNACKEDVSELGLVLLQGLVQLCSGVSVAQVLSQTLAAAGGDLASSLGADGRPLALMPDIRVRYTPFSPFMLVA